MLNDYKDSKLLSNKFFESRQIYLTTPDPQRDAETVSRWTHDPEYLRLTGTRAARPLAPDQVRTSFELDDKRARDQNQFKFMIRTRTDDRLIGTVKLSGIGWAHGFARLDLAIGDPADRGQGYGSETLTLILRYAFDELNLYRVAATTCSYNNGALRWLERAGFVIEVRQREAVKRAGQRWDLVHLAMVRPEWEAGQGREGG